MTHEMLKPEFRKCVYKTSVHYYKTVFIWLGIIVIGLLAIYGSIILTCAIYPIIVATLLLIPVWYYAFASLIVLPFIVAVIVCWIRRNNREINASDDEFTCPENQEIKW